MTPNVIDAKASRETARSSGARRAEPSHANRQRWIRRRARRNLQLLLTLRRLMGVIDSGLAAHNDDTEVLYGPEIEEALKKTRLLRELLER